MMTTTTTPPVTAVCSRALFITMAVTLALISVGKITLGQLDVVLAPQMIMEGFCYEGFCWPHKYATAATTSVPDAFSGICQLWHVSSTGKLLFQS